MAHENDIPDFLMGAPRLVRESPEYASTVGAMGPGFDVLAAFVVENPTAEAAFKAEAAALSVHGDPNVRDVWCSTTRDALEGILASGMPAPSVRRLFGLGLHLTADALRANDYNEAPRGDVAAVRVMLSCGVALGRSFAFELGRLDRTLDTPPAGFDSVTGFVRRAPELVTYVPARVCVRIIVLYRFTAPELELTIPRTVPEGTVGTVKFVTPPLCQFFTKLEMRVPDGPVRHNVRRLITSLVLLVITPDQFVSKLSALLHSPAPDVGLVAKIAIELTKMNE